MSALMSCSNSPSSINFLDLAAVKSDFCVPLMLSDDCLKVTCSFPDNSFAHLLASAAKNWSLLNGYRIEHIVNLHFHWAHSVLCYEAAVTLNATYQKYRIISNAVIRSHPRCFQSHIHLEVENNHEKWCCYYLKTYFEVWCCSDL